MSIRTENIFEMATRNKSRFPYKGMISVEDLWDLNQTQLDSIYKALNKEVKANQEDSLMFSQTQTDLDLQAKIEIVRHIYVTKEQDAARRAAAAENAEKKRRILEILEQKQEDSLKNKSEDELLKMLNEIG